MLRLYTSRTSIPLLAVHKSQAQPQSLIFSLPNAQSYTAWKPGSSFILCLAYSLVHVTLHFWYSSKASAAFHRNFKFLSLFLPIIMHPEWIILPWFSSPSIIILIAFCSWKHSWLDLSMNQAPHVSSPHQKNFYTLWEFSELCITYYTILKHQSGQWKNTATPAYHK